MKIIRTVLWLPALVAMSALGAEDFFDQLDEVLTFSSAQAGVSARVSGTLDLESYHFETPAPGLIYTPDNQLVNSRLTVFLDAQLGECFYFFMQGRVDRGFDPGDRDAQGRIDEYALRFTPGRGGHFSLQVGKFAAVVGNWVPRHGSWENPFVTAPLPYENLTGIWESVAARSSGVLLAWSHVLPTGSGVYADKHLRSPVIWGPSYASGVAIFGEVAKVSYAVEVKNAALASQPHSWSFGDGGFEHPTINARLGYRPNMMWNLGISASSGTYLRPEAERTIPTGYGLKDYRQVVVGQDIGFAWHYWQVWAEALQCRFEVPRVGDAEVFSYYVEVKYKFTPQFFGALRWNEQVFGDITHGGQRSAWGRDIERWDLAAIYRFTAHLQLKLQCSLQREAGLARRDSPLMAAQCTARF